MSRIPESLRRAIIAEIYRQADAIDWDGLSAPDRTRWYKRWINDSSIGKPLEPYLEPDQVRLWIKDGPMKHYRRARSGIGPYADLVASRLPDAPRLAQLAFGEAWTALAGSVRDKPNRCLVSPGDDQLTMIWGPARAFQSLLWTALNALVDQEPEPVILVTMVPGERLGDDLMKRHLDLGARVGVQVRHLTVQSTSCCAKEGPGES
ncbi:hypothetical protein [Micromonospora psammae]|uniref:hypothetical protein n=1 Tax=Micromonospora sp. CPCC 205556 TaxID=3122398 RepID=UPI002FF1599A